MSKQQKAAAPTASAAPGMGILLVVLLVVVPAVLASAPRLAHAAGDAANPAAVREAARHFQRGVALYSEADYQGALVEFQRAQALSPNQVVLYNIGETQYQLRDYAGALSTFDRYLAAAATTDPHRGQVESSVKVLRTRVGQLLITTAPVGAEVSIDDRVIGKTPLEGPVIVGVGRAKVTAVLENRPPATRYVDVAAEDNVSVMLELASPAAVKPAPFALGAPEERLPPPRDRGPLLRTVGWISTGVLALGAGAFAVLAYRESQDLSTARKHFPAMAASLDHKATVTRNLSIAADSLAAAAVVVGGVTLYSTLSARSRRNEADTSVMIGWRGIYLDGTF